MMRTPLILVFACLTVICGIVWLEGQSIGGGSPQCYTPSSKNVCFHTRNFFIWCGYPIVVELCTMNSPGYSVPTCPQSPTGIYADYATITVRCAPMWYSSMVVCCGGRVIGKWHRPRIKYSTESCMGFC